MLSEHTVMWIQAYQIYLSYLNTYLRILVSILKIKYFLKNIILNVQLYSLKYYITYSNFQSHFDIKNGWEFFF